MLDDLPERYPAGAFGLRVAALGALSDDEVAALDAVILGLNPVYHPHVTRRCADRGLAVVNPFEAWQRV